MLNCLVIAARECAVRKRISALEPPTRGISTRSLHDALPFFLPPCRFLVKMVPYSKLSVYLCGGMCGPEADSSVRTAETRGFQRCRALPMSIHPSTLPLSDRDGALC